MENTEQEKIIIYCDGGSRGNPGPAASAFVATRGEKLIFKKGKYLGIQTNNVAEYTAVIMALDWIINSKTTDQTVINLDSQLIERQINGFYRVRDMKLIMLHDKVVMKLKEIKYPIKFVWNYRSDNSLADKLVNDTLDAVPQREN